MLGTQVTEMVIFICLLLLWFLYLVAYFSVNLWGPFLPRSKRHLVVNLWSTAMRTRETWCRDLMSKADDAKGAALLAVQQMRNIIVASTLLVMGMAQIMGRLVVIMVTDTNLKTIAELCRKDPMTGPNESWAPPEVKVAVPFGATLVALLCFGQAVRLAVHCGFNIRVQGVLGSKERDGTLAADGGDKLLLDDAVVLMVQRTELYFTLGLRFLFLFIATVFWMLGITPLLVSCLTVLILLVVSDILIVPLKKEHARRRSPDRAVTAHPASSMA